MSVAAQLTSVDETISSGTSAAVGMASIALIHVLDLQAKLQETPYMGVTYVGLILAAIATAVLLLHERARRTSWYADGGIAGATLIGYAVNRTIGMPGMSDRSR
jgi:hypothetical protein